MQLARITVQISRYALIAVVLGLSLFAGGALAAGETVIPDVSVDATHGNGQRKLVTDSDGSLYLIYAARLDGADAIVVSRSDDAGSSWEQDAVLSRPGIRAGLGSLTFDSFGTLHATWVDYETEGHVWYAARMDSTWTEGSKISPGPSYAGLPVVVPGRDSVHVLWYAVQPDDSYRHGALYEIRDTSQTLQGWTEPVLVSTGSADSLNPSAVADQRGNVHSIWYQIDGQNYRVNYAVWDGKRWTIPDAISPTDANVTQASIDIGPDGTIYLVWGQLDAGATRVAFSRLAEGSWSDPEFLTEGSGEDPVLATDSEGNVIAAWSADDEIIVRRWESGEWRSPEMIGLGISPMFASGEPVTIAWTRPVGTDYEIVVTDLPGLGGTSLVPLLLGVGALVVILAALMLRRRSRTRPE